MRSLSDIWTDLRAELLGDDIAVPDAVRDNAYAIGLHDNLPLRFEQGLTEEEYLSALISEACHAISWEPAGKEVAHA